jgi:hypothetical protein
MTISKQHSEKYEKYIIRNPALFPDDNSGMSLRFVDNVRAAVGDSVMPIVWCEPRLQAKANSILELGLITKDGVSPSGPGEIGVSHKHNYDEIFLFLGTNPDDISDLGCTVEYWVGEGSNTEKIVVDTSTCMWVPAGLAHHPMVFKNVRRTAYYFVVMLNTDERIIIPASQEGKPKFM